MQKVSDSVFHGSQNRFGTYQDGIFNENKQGFVQETGRAGIPARLSKVDGRRQHQLLFGWDNVRKVGTLGWITQVLAKVGGQERGPAIVVENVVAGYIGKSGIQV